MNYIIEIIPEEAIVPEVVIAPVIPEIPIEPDDDEIVNDIDYDIDIMPPLIIINNNIPHQQIIDNINDLPVVNENNIIITFDDLLDQLDNFIEINTIRQYIMAHINYILFLNQEHEGIYNNDQINNILCAYNIANMHEFNDDEKIIIENFKDIINQSNNDQKKHIFNIFSGYEN
jgi:hypothetical protein